MFTYLSVQPVAHGGGMTTERGEAQKKESEPEPMFELAEEDQRVDAPPRKQAGHRGVRRPAMEAVMFADPRFGPAP
jgi:hypothetical protein